MVDIISSEEHFKTEIENNQLVLLDFSADWCGPCKSFAPIFEEYSKENAKTVKCLKIDIDKHQEIAAQYQVRSIPSLILIKNGKQVDNKVGALRKDDLVKWVAQFN